LNKVLDPFHSPIDLLDILTKEQELEGLRKLLYKENITVNEELNIKTKMLEIAEQLLVLHEDQLQLFEDSLANREANITSREQELDFMVQIEIYKHCD
jgi:hypothetical protein